MVEVNKSTYFKKDKITTEEIKTRTEKDRKTETERSLTETLQACYIREEKKINDSDKIQIYSKWEEYNLKEELLRGIYSLGFENPSYIQTTAIAPIIQRRNLRAQAQSGTGKTAAFGIGALQRLSGRRRTEVLVLVNTHEMAEQNCNRITSLAQYMGIDVVAAFGGSDVKQTIEALKKGPEIVVGTPGRITHMIRDGHLQRADIDLIVFDEADEMLNLGFQEQIREMLEFLPATAQIVMFSATWRKDVAMLADEILAENALIVDLRQDEQTLKGIDQYFVNLGARTMRNSNQVKLDVMLEIYEKNEVAQCIVFANTKRTAQYLYNEFVARNIACDLMNGDLMQNERAKVLEKFAKGNSRLLIATGLISRGIDIQQLSLVINFDIPPKSDMSNYIHRIGRAGRFGRKGKALNLVFSDERPTLKEIEEFYSTKMEPLPSNMDLK